MKLFDLYRYAKPSPGPDTEFVDGVRNLFHATRWPAWPALGSAGRVQLDHGINAIVHVAGPGGPRRPAVLIASKPHRAGSDWTPWHDELDPFVGHVRYYGDNKPERAADPLRAPGNRVLLEQFSLHRSNAVADRLIAAPLLFFEGLVHEGRHKGFWRFIGVGVIDRAERVVQVDGHDRLFTNYAFDCTLLDLGPENLELSWNWIAARRDPTRSALDCLKLAPENWQRWVKGGHGVLDQVRQSVARFRVLQPADQRPDPGTPAKAALQTVIEHYKTGGSWTGVGEHRFEGLASEITGAELSETGIYRRGWITKRAGDGGIDFVGRLDLGTHDATVELVVLGQAKCRAGEAPATSGLDLARTVARLDRGWIGSFVTTGYYTPSAQREVFADRYPLLLLSGRQVGETVAREAALRGMDVRSYIEAVDAEYESRISSRLPAEILHTGFSSAVEDPSTASQSSLDLISRVSPNASEQRRVAEPADQTYG